MMLLPVPLLLLLLLLLFFRLRGASMSTGSVLLFLDSHCEVTPFWLEPLLKQVSMDRKSVVSPRIDAINENTFAYAKNGGALQVGAFGWEFEFRW